ncbi:MAG TPA: hypothetical protein VFZ66_19000 [Herpetosiphonaceae bacterium]
MFIPLNITIYAVIVTEPYAWKLASQVMQDAAWVGIQKVSDATSAVQVAREHLPLLDHYRALLPADAAPVPPLTAEDVWETLTATIAGLGADGYTDVTSVSADHFIDLDPCVEAARHMPILDLAYVLCEIRDEHPAGDTFNDGLIEILRTTPAWDERLEYAQSVATAYRDRMLLRWLATGGRPHLPKLPPLVGQILSGPGSTVKVVAVGAADQGGWSCAVEHLAAADAGRRDSDPGSGSRR